MKKVSLILGVIVAGVVGYVVFQRISLAPPAGGVPVPAVKPAPVDPAVLVPKAEQGDVAAQVQLGKFYANSQGGPSSYKEAAKWYKMASDKGNAEGQLGFGELLEAGQGVTKDVAEAIRLYRLAAEQGLAAAQYTIGFMYEEGRGMPANQKEAAKWYILAANQGEPISQFDLGQRYISGLGVAVDRSEGLKWLRVAAAQGQDDAIKWIPKAKAQMSSAEIAEAEKRVAAFVPKKTVPDTAAAK
jgi:TPR repeat protein